MHPADVAANETLLFIERNIKLDGATVLEIGCGNGHLSKAMTERGAKVVAIDKSEEAIASATKLGVSALKADLFDYYPTERFDAVVFSRTLHHIHPPDKAMEATKRMVKNKGGLVLVDDFSVDMMDDRTLDWIRSVNDSLPSFVRGTSGAERVHSFPVNSLDEWNEHHLSKHKVAITGDLIEAAKCAYTSIRSESAAPYMFRYLVNQMSATAAAGSALQSVLDLERQSIQAGKIMGIGFRLVTRS